MAYIVAWTVIEKQKKQKKNALFIMPPIQHDLYEIKKRKSDAVRRYNQLVKTDSLAVVLGEVKEITINK